MKKWFYPVSLILLFIILITAVIPDGYVYGSNTDWLSQHVTLAETIRNACLEQHTLLPSWIGLGGGSNGYQFAYYGFLRPDILIGCLLPQIPMVDIIIGYMTAVYLCSVLLVYIWLKAERISPLLAWLGSMLFMTAGCLFHMHRQIMFVNYLLLFHIGFCRSRMVLVQDRRETVLAGIISETLYPLGCPGRGNGRSTPASHGSCTSGTQPAWHRCRASEAVRTVRAQSGI